MDEIMVIEQSNGLQTFEDAVKQMNARYKKQTPKKFLKERKGKGGQTWTFVDRRYVEQWLNKEYGTRWSFQIEPASFQTIGEHVHVLGRLTVVESDGTVRKVESYGAKEAIPSNGHLTPHPYLKSAESDALKRCAAMLGCAADVYKAETIEASQDNSVADPQIIAWFANAMCTIANSLPPEKLINLPKQFTALAEGKITKESIISNYAKLNIQL